MTGISTVQFGLRLFMAIGLGALVGLERQWRQRMAGTRTNALVAGGAAAMGALSGLGALNLALVLASVVLLTNMVLRPLAYRLHPVLPEATPIETMYEVRLACKVSAAAHIRALLLSTITSLPVTLQSIRGEPNEASDATNIRAEMTTVGRNNEAIEQVVMRLSIEDDVSTLSWSVVETAME
jgi:putative Mg2+ transporter-C (MgtC) family protein